MYYPKVFACPHRAGFQLVTFALLSAGLAACHHDGPRDGPNPCQGLKPNPLTCDFVEAYDTPTPDTAYNNQPLALRGPGAPYTSYQWQVGPTFQRTGRTVAVRFDDKTLGPIPVRLIATRPPNTACFPKDTGVDTLTKVLTLVPFRDPRTPIYGRFQGANRDTPRDTFSVRIYTGPNGNAPTNPAADPGNYVVGTPKGCRQAYRDVGVTWRGFAAQNASGGCTGLDISKGFLTTRDSVYIYYRTQVAPVIIDKIFAGKRVR